MVGHLINNQVCRRWRDGERISDKPDTQNHHAFQNERYEVGYLKLGSITGSRFTYLKRRQFQQMAIESVNYRIQAREQCREMNHNLTNWCLSVTMFRMDEPGSVQCTSNRVENNNQPPSRGDQSSVRIQRQGGLLTENPTRVSHESFSVGGPMFAM